MSAHDFRTILNHLFNYQDYTNFTEPTTVEAILFMITQSGGKDLQPDTKATIVAAYQAYEQLLHPEAFVAKEPVVATVPAFHEAAVLQATYVAPAADQPAPEYLTSSLRQHLKAAQKGLARLENKHVVELAESADIAGDEFVNWLHAPYRDLEEAEAVDAILLALEHVPDFTLEHALFELQAALPFPTYARLIRYHLRLIPQSADHAAAIASHAGVTTKQLIDWLDSGIPKNLNESDIASLAQTVRAKGYDFFQIGKSVV